MPRPRERSFRNQMNNRGCEMESAGDVPAGSRLFGDWATEFLLAKLPSVCFELLSTVRKISSFRRRWCPAFENRESWGSRLLLEFGRNQSLARPSVEQ
jgi:hypothetical protein